MIRSSSKPAYLVLADGTILEGKAFGHKGKVLGEVVFNTGMTGYQEVITDPSYFGQLITFTFPEIGNTGVNDYDQESTNSGAKGVITRQFSMNPSNWRCQDSFDTWLVKNKIVGLYGVDTRALVRHLRDYGSMNGVICNDGNHSPLELFEIINEAPSMKGLNLVNKVSTSKPYSWNTTCNVDFDIRKNTFTSNPFKVVAIDFGIKKSILDRLVSHGCDVKVLPSGSDYKEVMSFEPEGVFFSNGPGDPSSVTDGINLAKELLKNENLPIFGICLGHQILGLALGGNTFKLPFGHRGLNHPCGTKGRVEITSQNHGFALDAESLSESVVQISHFNLNDKTVAGITLRKQPVFGIQYHPEASPGPHDADHHFHRFVTLMEERRLSVV